MNYPKQVKLVEVGPRDGLQNETQTLDAAVKVELIERLAASGIPVVEAGSFVSPKWVPQMANTNEVMAKLTRLPNTEYPVLVPNLKGLALAEQAQAKHIAIFIAATDEFNQKNINATTNEALQRLTPVIQQALDHNLQVRGYISCVLGCPYAGKVSANSVSQLGKQLIDLGCNEISLGDTIGVGTANQVETLLNTFSQHVALSQVAVHFHDTYGQALANILMALQCGISIIDSAIAGLGGCPYAQGASGNVATEDVLYLLNGLNIATGIDLQQVLAASQYISQQLNRAPRAKVALALNKGENCERTQ